MNEIIKELIAKHSFVVGGNNDERIVWLETMDSSGTVNVDPMEELETFSKALIAASIDQAKKEVLEWIEAQAYSGDSHETDRRNHHNPDWLDMDEMRIYMPEAFDKVKKHFGIDT